MYTELSIEVTLQLFFTDTVIGASQMSQWVKNLLAIQVTWVSSLGLEDPLEEGMAVFLAGESHGQMSLEGYSPRGHRELDTNEAAGHARTRDMVTTIIMKRKG